MGISRQPSTVYQRVEMWSWRRIEEIIWTDRERNEVLKRERWKEISCRQ
jgi:hypothetical protein